MKHLEDNIQKAIVRYFRLTHPKDLIFAIPNGGNRDVRTGAILKATGVLAGVSDLIVIMQNRILFIEVKTKTGRQQQTQKDFQINVERLGFEYYIVRSLDEFINLVK